MHHEHHQFHIKVFFEKKTFTLTYIIFDPKTKDACVIDSVLDYDPLLGQYSYSSVKEVLDFIHSEKLNLHYILETHAHADHITASVCLKEEFPQAKIGIGERIKGVQEVFAPLFNGDIPEGTSPFDILFKDGQEVWAGSLNFKTLSTPGHTPACVSFFFKGEEASGDGALFTGDALFMPDFGTGRCDFPKGSARELYHSIADKIYPLGDDVKVYVGHDYQPGGRELRYQTTIGDSKRENIHLKAETTEAEFVKMREERDALLAPPRLLFPSLQVNIYAGHFPEKEENGARYLKIPFRKK